MKAPERHDAGGTDQTGANNQPKEEQENTRENICYTFPPERISAEHRPEFKIDGYNPTK